MEALSNYQRRLFPYAYNILGSAAEARDAIQDVIVKHISSPKANLDNETGYLVRSVINHSINLKKRSQKIVGDTTRLPEPVATEGADEHINRTEVLSYSLLVLLEHLNPKERAVFILKEAFDYSHEEIAETLSLSVDNSRKLFSRAKNELRKSQNFTTSTAPDPRILQDYIRNIQNGDTQALATMLSKEITVKTDGGHIKIVSPLVTGSQAVTDLMLYVYNNYQRSLSIRFGNINHQPALLFYDGDALVNCQVFEIDPNGTIKGIFSVVDPDKLKNLTVF
ncbi:sigma-70 family RNA polymerase sigma factor [Chryseolinea sp. T2]|uniref:sigma-70 family RNA polymerase sigma factor n=1 Tax=Chryseolinea sp. T2 TaxID=3129255 RepID=UPI0030772CFC